MIMVVVMLCFLLDSTFLRMKSHDFPDVDHKKKKNQHIINDHGTASVLVTYFVVVWFIRVKNTQTE